MYFKALKKINNNYLLYIFYTLLLLHFLKVLKVTFYTVFDVVYPLKD